MRTIDLAGVPVPVIGQGTWRMGEDPGKRSAEVAALQLGIDEGMTLIDTAEMYGEGGAEEVVGEAIRGKRDQVFLVSKVYPHNASHKGIPRACEASLQRLGTDYIDLYLLHWRGQYPLEETVEAFERLREAGKIGRWGVSNFDVADLQELASPACATNQVLYNIEERGIEFDLLPFCRGKGMPVMAYSPIEQARMLSNPALGKVAKAAGATPAQVAIAWLLQQDGVIAIPKATNPSHLREDIAALDVTLDKDALAALDRAFPPPKQREPLGML